ncbi:hypothetical protein KJ652_01525 [Patescibacteria group bacterium]|nr:hypothetical protein [Patescibacteria group bacterium]MBU1123248.1 hypothetical protein [Patescibacteria group bacterium]MBU1911613.1 hypothetical protein [Patescibacteria group bacterium]
MTSENRHEATKHVEDLLEYAFGEALARLFPTGSNAVVIRHHLRAVLNGTVLRTIELAMLHKDLQEDELFELVLRHLTSDPDYLRTGNLPLTSQEAESDENDPYLINQVLHELHDSRAQIAQRFPKLASIIEGTDFKKLGQ